MQRYVDNITISKSFYEDHIDLVLSQYGIIFQV